MNDNSTTVGRGGSPVAELEGQVLIKQKFSAQDCAARPIGLKQVSI